MIKHPMPGHCRIPHRVLDLVLAYHWYDLISQGDKHVEYRALIHHWTARIWYKRHSVTHVRFHRGYSPVTILRPIHRIDIGPCPYDGWNGDFYRVHFGVHVPYGRTDQSTSHITQEKANGS